MDPKQFTRSVARFLAGGIGLAAASYSAYVAAAWFRYGRAVPRGADAADILLDRFMPQYEVRDHHSVFVAAPAEVTLSAAAEVDFESCALVRGILKAREWILRSEPEHTRRPRGLIARTKSLGWGLLAERPGRAIVMGCATKPWDANPVFIPLRPDEFVAFDKPGYVKIAWTLQADPVGVDGSVFRTETRAIATDDEARAKFRRYWSLLSPGIILIRLAMLPAVKAAAQRLRQEVAA